MRVILIALALVAGWIGLHSVLTVVFGWNEKPRPADVAVVLGTRVDRSGVASRSLRARLDRAVELYRTAYVKNVIVSGGLGREGFEEADVMRDYLVARGLPASAILLDRGGEDTYASARNAARIMRAASLRSAVIVSDYYHLPRARLAFSRFGIEDLSAVASYPPPSGRDAFNLLREFFAYYFYLVRDYGSA